jgi:uncharacterized protein
MLQRLRSRKLQIVFKITKHCNLRCSYCYEFPFLGQKGFVGLADVERLIRHLADYEFDVQSPHAGEDGFEFIWHGGEPLMVPMDHYESIGRLQRAILGPLAFRNVVQTNLTILTARHPDWFKQESFFKRDSIGFSFDVYGDQRTDITGAQTTQKVLDNLGRLLANDISVGGITVLSRSTVGHVANIFRFYDDLGLGFRLLPFHLEVVPGQAAVNGVAQRDIVAAMCLLFDLWRQSEQPVVVAPLNEYIEDAIAVINGQNGSFYDKASDESIFIIDTNGDVYGGEPYLPEHCYGNLFRQPFDEVLASPARAELVAQSRRRMETYCTDCPFFGSCSGYPVAEANPMEREWLRHDGCYVAPILAHIVQQLSRAGLGRMPGFETASNL